MRLIHIVGARPQFIKLAPLTQAIDRHNASAKDLIENLVIHTGQHYDPAMSDVFFQELAIPQPQYELGVGSGPHGRQTGLMLEKIEQILMDAKPDVVVTYGDTNSTLAGSLAASKLHFPLAHVESGLRSFNRHMPEEINRLVADHVSDLLLAPTQTAMRNLDREGLLDRSVFTGDIMYDTVLLALDISRQHSTVLQRLNLMPKAYGLVTVHRAENTDDNHRLQGILDALNGIAADGLTLVFPLHPRTRQRLVEHLPGFKAHSNLHMIDPVGYLDMLSLTKAARITLTDSGGLQKEALFLGSPCITLRDETEWVETTTVGMNTIAGADPGKIKAAATHALQQAPYSDDELAERIVPLFGDGRAADNILNALVQFCSDR